MREAAASHEELRYAGHCSESAQRRLPSLLSDHADNIAAGCIATDTAGSLPEGFTVGIVGKQAAVSPHLRKDGRAARRFTVGTLGNSAGCGIKRAPADIPTLYDDGFDRGGLGG